MNWTEVATKSDLRELRVELRGEIAELRGEVKSDIVQATRSIYFAMVASQATLVGLVFAAVKLG